ncbi:MAG: alpha/beta hydrolase family protein [Phycisphaerae bacterium]
MPCHPRPSTFIAGALLALFAATRTLAAPYTSPPPTHETTELRQTWHDPARNRDIPLLLVYPKDLTTLPAGSGRGADKYPIILFSHGLGGSRETYRTYGEAWAKAGYIVLFPQHIGSDTSVIGPKMLQMLRGQGDLQPFLDRVADIHFLIDQLQAAANHNPTAPNHNPTAPNIPGLADHLDLTKIGMSGHSFGAITTQAIAGQHYATANLADPRVKAAIAMSGSGSKDLDQDAAFKTIKIPVFYLTGTEDHLGMIGAGSRRTPFDHSSHTDTFLLNLTGANHMTFAPFGRAAGNPSRQKFQPLILELTTAFWDAYLKDLPAAKTWFNTDLPAEVGPRGKFESKHPAPAPSHPLTHAAPASAAHTDQ